MQIPSIPIPTIINPQQGGTSSIPSSRLVTQIFLPPATQISAPNSTLVVQMSTQSSTPIISEIPPRICNHDNSIGLDTSTQTNPIGKGTSTQNNPIGKGDSSC